MSSEQQPVDRERTEAIAYAALIAIKANYRRGPISRDRVLEALNALAGCTATVIAGADDVEAYDFFMKALNQNLAEYGDQSCDLN